MNLYEMQQYAENASAQEVEERLSRARTAAHRAIQEIQWLEKVLEDKTAAAPDPEVGF